MKITMDSNISKRTRKLSDYLIKNKKILPKGVFAIILYGSALKNTFKKTSDIDIAYFGHASLDECLELFKTIQSFYNYEVDWTLVNKDTNPLLGCEIQKAHHIIWTQDFDHVHGLFSYFKRRHEDEQFWRKRHVA